MQAVKSQQKAEQLGNISAEELGDVIHQRLSMKPGETIQIARMVMDDDIAAVVLSKNQNFIDVMKEIFTISRAAPSPLLRTESTFEERIKIQSKLDEKASRKDSRGEY